MEALADVAALFEQEVMLTSMLDPHGSDLHPVGMREGDNGSRDGRAAAITRQPGHDTVVQFGDIDGQ